MAHQRGNLHDSTNIAAAAAGAGEVVVRGAPCTNLTAAGLSQSRRLLYDVWNDSSSRSAEYWSERAKAEARDRETLALHAASASTSTRNRCTSLTPYRNATWRPPPRSLSGDESSLITEVELEQVLSNQCGTALESEWRNQFDGVIGMTDALDNVAVGPQRAAADGAAKRAFDELPNHSPDLCCHRGDCRKFSIEVRGCGGIVTTHICRYLKQQGGAAVAPSAVGDNAAGGDDVGDAAEKGKGGCDMLAVFSLRFTDANKTFSLYFLTVHALFKPYRVIAWQVADVAGAPHRKRLAFADGLPKFALSYQMIADVDVDWQSIQEVRLTAHNFLCADWSTFELCGIVVEFDCTRLQGAVARPLSVLEESLAAQRRAVAQLLRGSAPPPASTHVSQRLARIGLGLKKKVKAKAKAKTKANAKSIAKKKGKATTTAAPSAGSTPPPVGFSGGSSSSGSGSPPAPAPGVEGGESTAWIGKLLFAEETLTAAKKKIANSSRPTGSDSLALLQPRWTDKIDFRFVESALGSDHYRWMDDNAHAIQFDPRKGEFGAYIAVVYHNKLKSGRWNRKEFITIAQLEVPNADGHLFTVLTLWEDSLIEAVAAYAAMGDDGA